MPTNRLFQLVSVITGLLSLAASPAYAGFDFSFFRLRSLTQDSSGASIITDRESIDTPRNPVHVLQETGFGSSYSRSMFDVSWLEYSGIFNVSFEQHIEDIDFLTSARRRLDFVADVDLLVTVDSEINWSSSGADFAIVQESFLIQDTHSAPLLRANFTVGAGAIAPASGTFTLNEQVLLPAGAEYTIDFIMKGISVGVAPPLHAPIDITGHSNLSIMPVPEPASALLLAVASIVALRRRRRPQISNNAAHDAPPLPSP